MTDVAALGWRKRFLRALIEVASIMFLFYSNLLMGEFNRSNHHAHTLRFALHDIVTRENLAIGVIAALLGYGVFEFLRRKL
jgi:hypothetical protein